MEDIEKKTDLKHDDQNEKGTQPTGDTANELIVIGRDGFQLFPQPVLKDPLDPLNWSKVQKNSILAIVMAL